MAPVVVFRAATAADADAVVPLVYSSGPAAFDYVFGQGQQRRAEAFLYYAFAHESGEFSYRTHHVALRGSAVVAAGAIFDGRQTVSFTLAAARQIVGFYGLPGALGVITRGLRTESVIRPPRAREQYLCHLGVAPELRGAGIGSELIRHLLAQSRTSLHDYVALDVSVNNPRAHALYKKLGFEAIALRRSTLSNASGAVADHWRMTLR